MKLTLGTALYLLVWACVGAVLGPANFDAVPGPCGGGESGCCFLVLPALLAWPLLLIGQVQIASVLGYALVGRAVLGIVDEFRSVTSSSRPGAR